MAFASSRSVKPSGTGLENKLAGFRSEPPPRQNVVNGPRGPLSHPAIRNPSSSLVRPFSSALAQRRWFRGSSAPSSVAICLSA